MPLQPDHYALVIGIDDYPSGDLRSLEHAKHDAEAFRNWLIDPGTGGGVPEQNCKLILSRGELLLPNFDEIDDRLLEIMELAKQSQANARRLYFYFSGHGMAASKFQTFLCLPRWSNLRRNAALDSQAFSSYLVDSGLFRAIVFLFDCCRSYKPSVAGHITSLGDARANPAANQSRLFVAFAASHLDQAFEESEVDGHGFFTRALLSGLKGGACQDGGGAPAHKLKAFIESETRNLAEAAGKIQNAEVFYGFPAKPEPVFRAALPLGQKLEGNAPLPAANVTASLAYSISVSFPSEHQIVLIDPGGLEMPWDQSRPWRVRVGQGLHLIENKTTGQVRRLPRDVPEGEINVQF